MIQFEKASAKTSQPVRAILITSEKPVYKGLGISNGLSSTVERLKDTDKKTITLFEGDKTIIIQKIENKKEKYQSWELARRAGSTLASELSQLSVKTVEITSDGNEDVLLAYAEGIALGSYKFEKYKKTQKSGLQTIFIKDISNDKLNQLKAVVEANIIARDLINRPLSDLTAEMLGDYFIELGKEAGFKTEVFNKARITSLKMGGLLGVNMGSMDPPTFSIMEYKPKKAVNKKPIIFVGKGVTYDTGGLTLKPTPGSMDQMKSDMSGAAAVAGVLYAAAKSKMPLHIIGLVPATDNRPGGNAIVPGDVISLCDGTTVEVLNTDAEGRLILGDALSYAKKYKPELVIDLATLTGAAARAIGQWGIVYMGTASEKTKKLLENSGRNTYERLVEFPLWDEYAELLKSDIADMKNVSSGASAGAITAGKFLQHFTDYPWLHLDIAGPAFLTSADSYRGKNASGVGVRLLMDFLQNYEGK